MNSSSMLSLDQAATSGLGRSRSKRLADLPRVKKGLFFRRECLEHKSGVSGLSTISVTNESQISPMGMQSMLDRSKDA